ncbi:YceI family protein [Flagellimonas sp. HMM57]|uniref:YceI family protein n=1 Tax=unclassified Flagellimonas TaxID=2644544 RepID=UPI0013CF7CB9|nr:MULTISPECIES: YceI family protein [unclassified Flagellimonas]UII77686.1 YceI family protein [Flagellimonas sp. HMM57]
MKNSILKTNNLIFCLLFCIVTSTVSAQESTWKIDPNHSTINFEISYFKVGTIKGAFDTYSGSFTQKDNTFSGVAISIQTASINTNQEDRDKHLRTGDFFSAEEHPEITFTSTEIRKTGTDTYELKGNFTMSGITKPIVLKATEKGSYVHPRFKTDNVFMTITGIIPREEFNVGTNYPPAKFALGKEVSLVAEIQLTKEES